jgi:hypothetical protein
MPDLPKPLRSEQIERRAVERDLVAQLSPDKDTRLKAKKEGRTAARAFEAG